jgi:hypothetical protein
MKTINLSTLLLFALLLSCTPSSNKKTIKIDNEQPELNESQKSNQSESVYYQSKLDSNKFENFKVVEKYKGTIAKFDKNSFKDLPKEYLETIQSQYKKEKRPNFAGQYIIVTWACGTACQMHAIIDVKTGKTLEYLNSSLGLSFRNNSYLLISNPPSNEVWNEESRKIFGEPKFMVFKNQKLIEIE